MELKFPINLILLLVLIAYPIHSILADQKIDIGTISWVTKKIKDHPELIWLLASNENYSIGQENNSSWSKQLIGMNSNEFEKTLTSLMCLDLIYDGSKNSYLKFISHQKENYLTYENFQEMYDMVHELEQKDIIISRKYLEKNIIVRDLGKSETFKNYIKDNYGIIELDPHYFTRALLKNAHYFCTKNLAIPENFIKIFLETDVFHFGHIKHLEGGIEMLTTTKNSKIFSNKNLLNFRFITDLLEIAGCMGNVINQGSCILNNDTYESSKEVFKTIKILKNNSEINALRFYFSLKASEYNHELRNEIDFIAIKIASMMKLNILEFKLLYSNLSNLTLEQQNLLIKHLNPLTKRNERTPTYTPNFLSALYKQNNKSNKLNIEQKMKIFIDNNLSLLLKVFEQHRKNIKEIAIEKQPILSFNIATKQSDDGFVVDKKTKFEIKNGIVRLLK